MILLNICLPILWPMILSAAAAGTPQEVGGRCVAGGSQEVCHPQEFQHLRGELGKK